MRTYCIVCVEKLIGTANTSETSRTSKWWRSWTHLETWSTLIEHPNAKSFCRAESQIISGEPLLTRRPFYRKCSYSYSCPAWPPQKFCAHSTATFLVSPMLALLHGTFTWDFHDHKALNCHGYRLNTSYAMSMSPEMIEVEGFVSKEIRWTCLQCSRPPYPTVFFAASNFFLRCLMSRAHLIPISKIWPCQRPGLHHLIALFLQPGMKMADLTKSQALF